MNIGSGYSLAGHLIAGHSDAGYPLKDMVIRCNSCGSLLLPQDQGIHDDHHALLNRALGREEK